MVLRKLHESLWNWHISSPYANINFIHKPPDTHILGWFCIFDTIFSFFLTKLIDEVNLFSNYFLNKRVIIHYNGNIMLFRKYSCFMIWFVARNNVGDLFIYRMELRWITMPQLVIMCAVKISTQKSTFLCNIFSLSNMRRNYWIDSLSSCIFFFNIFTWPFMWIN